MPNPVAHFDAAIAAARPAPLTHSSRPVIGYLASRIARLNSVSDRNRRIDGISITIRLELGSTENTARCLFKRFLVTHYHLGPLSSGFHDELHGS
jgi:hypothetical protein